MFVPATAAGLLLVTTGAAYLCVAVAWRQAALLLVGTLAGVVLYHSAFGFTSAWRALLVEGHGAALRAQMLMLGLASAVFVPLLAAGTVFGQAVRGAAAPLGAELMIGACLFGIGMQLGGGCASGTLYSAGGGSPRTLATLAGFVAGSLMATRHASFWAQWPSTPPITLLSLLGPTGAVAVSVAVAAALAILATRIERGRRGTVDGILATGSGARHLLRGPWPLAWGAVGLVGINVATLVLAGRPWGVTSAFALWGAKLAQLLGADVATWTWWQAPARAASLAAPVTHDVTSVMNVGIMLGALVAAGLAGRFAPVWRIPLRSLVAAVLGGLLLGYGARLASGCNIGAFFSGVASTSLHGWLWFAAALAGNWIGTRLRPRFGLR